MGDIEIFEQLTMRMAGGDEGLAEWLRQLAAVVMRTELGLTGGLAPHQFVYFAELESKVRDVTADPALRDVYIESVRRTIAYGKQQSSRN